MFENRTMRGTVIALKLVTILIMITGGAMASINLLKTHTLIFTLWPFILSIILSLFILNDSKLAIFIGFLLNFIVGFSIFLGRFSALGILHSSDSLLTVILLILIGLFSSAASIIYIHELFHSDFSKRWRRETHDSIL